MCVSVEHAPTPDPSIVTLPATVTIRMGLRSGNPADVTVVCKPGLLGRDVSRPVHVDGHANAEIPVELSGGGRGAAVIDVEIHQPGCVTQRLAVGVTVR